MAEIDELNQRQNTWGASLGMGRPKEEVSLSGAAGEVGALNQALTDRLGANRAAYESSRGIGMAPGQPSPGQQGGLPSTLDVATRAAGAIPGLGAATGAAAGMIPGAMNAFTYAGENIQRSGNQLADWWNSLYPGEQGLSPQPQPQPGMIPQVQPQPGIAPPIAPGTGVQPGIAPGIQPAAATSVPPGIAPDVPLLEGQGQPQGQFGMGQQDALYGMGPQGGIHPLVAEMRERNARMKHAQGLSSALNIQSPFAQRTAIRNAQVGVEDGGPRGDAQSRYNVGKGRSRGSSRGGSADVARERIRQNMQAGFDAQRAQYAQGLQDYRPGQQPGQQPERQQEAYKPPKIVEYYGEGGRKQKGYMTPGGMVPVGQPAQRGIGKLYQTGEDYTSGQKTYGTAEQIMRGQEQRAAAPKTATNPETGERMTLDPNTNKWIPSR